MTLGEFIKKKRKECGISVTKLSQLTNISQPYISQIESGNRKPSLEKMKLIAYSLGIDYNEILYISENINAEKNIEEKKQEIFDLYEILKNPNLSFKEKKISEKQKQKIKSIIEIIIND